MILLDFSKSLMLMRPDDLSNLEDDDRVTRYPYVLQSLVGVDSSHCFCFARVSGPGLLLCGCFLLGARLLGFNALQKYSNCSWCT